MMHRKAYAKAVKLEPNFTAALYNRAQDLDNLEKFDESAEVYADILETHPKSIESWLGKGNALHELGK
ncbi:MAG: hypothetical protein R2741_05495 [Methanolobus sp.]